jgi:hypothetical protein
VKPIFLFWLSVTMAWIHVLALVFIQTQGFWSWSGVGLTLFWLGLAWFHGSRVPKQS